MNKFGVDSKVKKTLLRNYEQKLNPNARQHVKHDVGQLKLVFEKSSPSQKENELSQPTLCSSEALANYLSGVKKSMPPSHSTEELNFDKGHLSKSKITKKLNFHFNDKIYRNLIELNANVAELKGRNNKRPSSSTMPMKKDLEPNIEDFYEDVKEVDSPPPIPVIKPIYKPVKKVETGQLHKLVAAFENL